MIWTNTLLVLIPESVLPRFQSRALVIVNFIATTAFELPYTWLIMRKTSWKYATVDKYQSNWKFEDIQSHFLHFVKSFVRTFCVHSRGHTPKHNNAQKSTHTYKILCNWPRLQRFLKIFPSANANFRSVIFTQPFRSLCTQTYASQRSHDYDTGITFWMDMTNFCWVNTSLVNSDINNIWIRKHSENASIRVPLLVFTINSLYYPMFQCPINIILHHKNIKTTAYISARKLALTFSKLRLRNKGHELG